MKKKTDFFEEHKVEPEEDLFGDFPDASEIKSSKGNPLRPETKVDIQYNAPTGFKFQFGYDNNRPGYFLVPDDQSTMTTMTNK